MGSSQTYPAYKDSGVGCLGRVPSHWQVRRLRDLAQMRASNVDKQTVEGEEAVRLCNYVDVYKNDCIRPGMSFMRATATKNEISRFRLIAGDVLITKDSEAWDDIGVPALVVESADDLVCGYHLALLRPFPMVMTGGFLFRASQSQGVQYQFHVEANGVTRYGLSHSAIKSVSLPVPPLTEQAAIVRFLDYVDRRVHRYIRAKQELIKLLEEQKRAIIHQAVIGQIDVRTGKPYAAYRDSGVEWLDQVPGHWSVVRLKNLVCGITSGSRGWSGFAANEGALFIRIANLARTSIILRFDDVVRLQLPAAVLSGEARRTRVQAGDVLLSITAYIGSVGVVPEGLDEAYVSQHVACCRPRQGVVAPKWLGYVLLSPVGQIHGQLSMYGGTKQGLSLDDVKNYLVLVPPVEEQALLVELIEKECASIDHAINEERRVVALLREYRTRLIADVVTGKLDVREVAASLPNEIDAGDLFEEDSLIADEDLAEEIAEEAALEEVDA